MALVAVLVMLAGDGAAARAVTTGRGMPSVGPSVVAAVVGGVGASLSPLPPTGMVGGMPAGVPEPSGHRLLGAIRVPHGGGGGG